MNRRAITAATLSARLLSIDMIERAKSGHPGLPLGCAELGVLLFYEILRHNPEDPHWINRDRFVLSAGHGSALLYSLLYLTGYGLTLEDLKNFRRVESKTPGHPERGETPGVDVTTGILGQGFGTAVGMAIAEKMLSARLNTSSYSIIDHFTFVLASDGDLMEGVTSEAASLAGHLGLGKLIVFYDDNQITIDGKTDLTFSEDVMKRFEAYHWQTLSGDAYDLEGILELVQKARQDLSRPSLIRLTSLIGKGSPGLAGSHKAHGGALGEEEVRRTKTALGVDEGVQFYVSEEALSYAQEKRAGWVKEYRLWEETFRAWKQDHPDLYRHWIYLFEEDKKEGISYTDYKPGQKVATRIAGGRCLDRVLPDRPDLVGGSADLTVPCFGNLNNVTAFQKTDPRGNFIYYGIREHAMGAISNGLALHGGFRPYCATFMAFSDYMRPSIRLAALMRLPVIYILTHDSVLVGEDGPTHQPVEHLATLRAIPGLTVFRPADAEETEAVWALTLANRSGPAVIALTRQEVEVFEKKDPAWRENIYKGAYIVRDCPGMPELVIVATGSEVQLALELASQFRGRRIRVVSMPCRELFFSQGESYRKRLIPDGARRMVMELGVPLGWERLYTSEVPIFGLHRFGVSGPWPDVRRHLHRGAEALREEVEKLLSKEGGVL